MDGCEIFPEKSRTVQIMPVIHENLTQWIKAVDEIPTPVIRRENRFMNIFFFDESHSPCGEAGLTELGIHHLMRTERALVKANPQTQYNCDNGPDMTAKAGFHHSHSR